MWCSGVPNNVLALLRKFPTIILSEQILLSRAVFSPADTLFLCPFYPMSSEQMAQYTTLTFCQEETVLAPPSTLPHHFAFINPFPKLPIISGIVHPVWNEPGYMNSPHQLDLQRDVSWPRDSGVCLSLLCPLVLTCVGVGSTALGAQGGVGPLGRPHFHKLFTCCCK